MGKHSYSSQASCLRFGTASHHSYMSIRNDCHYGTWQTAASYNFVSGRETFSWGFDPEYIHSYASGEWGIVRTADEKGNKFFCNWDTNPSSGSSFGCDTLTWRKSGSLYSCFNGIGDDSNGLGGSCAHHSGLPAWSVSTDWMRVRVDLNRRRACFQYDDSRSWFCPNLQLPQGEWRLVASGTYEFSFKMGDMQQPSLRNSRLHSQLRLGERGSITDGDEPTLPSGRAGGGAKQRGLVGFGGWSLNGGNDGFMKNSESCAVSTSWLMLSHFLEFFSASFVF